MQTSPQATLLTQSKHALQSIQRAIHGGERLTEENILIRIFQVNANISSNNFTHTATHAYSHKENIAFNLLKEHSGEKSIEENFTRYKEGKHDLV